MSGNKLELKILASIVKVIINIALVLLWSPPPKKKGTITCAHQSLIVITKYNCTLFDGRCASPRISSPIALLSLHNPVARAAREPQ